MSLTLDQFKKIALLAARKADDKSGEDIVLLDLKKSDSTVCEYLLLVTATSDVHVRAIKNEIEHTLKEAHLSPLHQEGARGDCWAILDYGGFMAHIFNQATRNMYSLERLWEKGKPVLWQEPSARLKATKTTKKAKPKKKKTSKRK